ncbi:MAG: hypothetical protein KatS3mg015_2798 [Fimbriimonadales bacterium]|nr:MAG: hypothetical protein KatS3mg015_2798 [Fimbriimonadales bacterium]
MTAVTLAPEVLAEAQKLRELERAQMLWAYQHPRYLLQFVTCVDSRSGEVFQFELLTEEECKLVGAEFRDTGWMWQREYLDWCWENDQTCTLKGRQLGVTWIWAGLALWYLIFRPGTDVLVYSIKEDDAAEVVNRIWDMWESLKGTVFVDGLRVLKPARDRPTTRIEILHPDGKVSTVQGMVSTKKAGHSRSAALVIFDEAAHQEYARELWKAVIPATGDKGGKIGAISTANGVSDGKGQGNFFHELWTGAGAASFPNVRTKFLRWDLHPGRDQAWYDSVPLPPSEKAEQYPNSPDEAFLLTGSPYFDVQALRYYAENPVNPIGQYEFVTRPWDPATAVLRPTENGPVTLWRMPDEGHRYAIGVDVATGSGTDFSCAYVIDLKDAAIVGELYMKADYDRFSEQLHFLGKLFHTAWIAVEKGGGYGDVVIGHLRSGHQGRQPYSNLYRHRSWDHPTRPTADNLGYPMNVKTRAHVVASLRAWINDRLLPWLPQRAIGECRTFVHRSTTPTPRAADGCNDDRVMALGIALVLYEERGEHEHDRKKKTLRRLPKPKPTSALDPRAQRSR